jgi:glycerophosphoryl diester phosphodiesterase
MPKMQADCVQVPTRARRLVVVDRRFVDSAHRAGLQVHVWTIDDAAEMGELLDLGVDAIMTDRPRLLREVLTARGQWHGAALVSA